MDMGQRVADCYSGESAPCRQACPLDIDIPEFITRIQRGNFKSAYNLLRDQAIFPQIVHLICGKPCAGSGVWAGWSPPTARITACFMRDTSMRAHTRPVWDIRVFPVKANGARWLGICAWRRKPDAGIMCVMCPPEKA